MTAFLHQGSFIQFPSYPSMYLTIHMYHAAYHVIRSSLLQPAKQLRSPLFRRPHITLKVMLPEPLEPAIQIFQCFFDTEILASPRIPQVVNFPALSSGVDLLLSSRSSDLVVGFESCFDCSCTTRRGFVERV